MAGDVLELDGCGRPPTMWSGGVYVQANHGCTVPIQCTSVLPPLGDLSFEYQLVCAERIATKHFLNSILPIGERKLSLAGAQVNRDVFQPCFMDIDIDDGKDGMFPAAVWDQLQSHLQHKDRIAITHQYGKSIGQCNLFLFIVPDTIARSFCSFEIPEGKCVGIFYWAGLAAPPFPKPACKAAQTLDKEHPALTEETMVQDSSDTECEDVIMEENLDNFSSRAQPTLAPPDDQDSLKGSPIENCEVMNEAVTDWVNKDGRPVIALGDFKVDENFTDASLGGTLQPEVVVMSDPSILQPQAITGLSNLQSQPIDDVNTLEAQTSNDSNNLQSQPIKDLEPLETQTSKDSNDLQSQPIKDSSNHEYQAINASSSLQSQVIDDLSNPGVDGIRDSRSFHSQVTNDPSNLQSQAINGFSDLQSQLIKDSGNLRSQTINDSRNIQSQAMKDSSNLQSQTTNDSSNLLSHAIHESSSLQSQPTDISNLKSQAINDPNNLLSQTTKDSSNIQPQAINDSDNLNLAVNLTFCSPQQIVQSLDAANPILLENAANENSHDVDDWNSAVARCDETSNASSTDTAASDTALADIMALIKSTDSCSEGTSQTETASEDSNDVPDVSDTRSTVTSTSSVVHMKMDDETSSDIVQVQSEGDKITSDITKDIKVDVSGAKDGISSKGVVRSFPLGKGGVHHLDTISPSGTVTDNSDVKCLSEVIKTGESFGADASVTPSDLPDLGITQNVTDLNSLLVDVNTSADIVELGDMLDALSAGDTHHTSDMLTTASDVTSRQTKEPFCISEVLTATSDGTSLQTKEPRCKSEVLPTSSDVTSLRSKLSLCISEVLTTSSDVTSRQTKKPLGKSKVRSVTVGDFKTLSISAPKNTIMTTDCLEESDYGTISTHLAEAQEYGASRSPGTETKDSPLAGNEHCKQECGTGPRTHDTASDVDVTSNKTDGPQSCKVNDTRCSSGAIEMKDLVSSSFGIHSSGLVSAVSQDIMKGVVGEDQAPTGGVRPKEQGTLSKGHSLGDCPSAHSNNSTDLAEIVNPGDGIATISLKESKAEEADNACTDTDIDQEGRSNKPNQDVAVKELDKPSPTDITTSQEAPWSGPRDVSNAVDKDLTTHYDVKYQDKDDARTAGVLEAVEIHCTTNDDITELKHTYAAGKPEGNQDELRPRAISPLVTGKTPEKCTQLDDLKTLTLNELKPDSLDTDNLDRSVEEMPSGALKLKPKSLALKNIDSSVEKVHPSTFEQIMCDDSILKRAQDAIEKLNELHVFQLKKVIPAVQLPIVTAAFGSGIAEDVNVNGLDLSARSSTVQQCREQPVRATPESEGVQHHWAAWVDKNAQIVKDALHTINSNDKTQLSSGSDQTQASPNPALSMMALGHDDKTLIPPYNAAGAQDQLEGPLDLSAKTALVKGNPGVQSDDHNYVKHPAMVDGRSGAHSMSYRQDTPRPTDHIYNAAFNIKPEDMSREIPTNMSAKSALLEDVCNVTWLNQQGACSYKVSSRPAPSHIASSHPDTHTYSQWPTQFSLPNTGSRPGGAIGMAPGYTHVTPMVRPASFHTPGMTPFPLAATQPTWSGQYWHVDERQASAATTASMWSPYSNVLLPGESTASYTVQGNNLGKENSNVMQNTLRQHGMTSAKSPQLVTERISSWEESPTTKSESQPKWPPCYITSPHSPAFRFLPKSAEDTDVLDVTAATSSSVPGWSPSVWSIRQQGDPPGGPIGSGEKSGAASHTNAPNEHDSAHAKKKKKRRRTKSNEQNEIRRVRLVPSADDGIKETPQDKTSEQATRYPLLKQSLNIKREVLKESPKSAVPTQSALELADPKAVLQKKVKRKSESDSFWPPCFSTNPHYPTFIKKESEGPFTAVKDFINSGPAVTCSAETPAVSGSLPSLVSTQVSKSDSTKAYVAKERQTVIEGIKKLKRTTTGKAQEKVLGYRSSSIPYPVPAAMQHMMFAQNPYGMAVQGDQVSGYLMPVQQAMLHPGLQHPGTTMVQHPGTSMVQHPGTSMVQHPGTSTMQHPGTTTIVQHPGFQPTPTSIVQLQQPGGGTVQVLVPMPGFIPRQCWAVQAQRPKDDKRE